MHSKKTKDILYFYAGFVMRQTKSAHKKTVCTNCFKNAIRPAGTKGSYDSFIDAKSKIMKNLIYVKEYIFKLYLEMELTFRRYYKAASSNVHINLKQFFQHKFQNLHSNEYECANKCNFTRKYINRYITMRLKSQASKKHDIKQKLDYASKTVAMKQRTT